MEKKTTVERINLVKTSYHYYRNWVNQLLKDGGVEDYKFIKEEGSFKGQISIPKSEEKKTKEVFQKYRKENPDVVDLWW